MFALEFARSLARRSGPALAPLSIPASLQELVRARVAEQPQEIRRLLAVAAAAERPTPSLLAAIDTESPRLLDAAVDLGVVGVGDDGIVRFTHPLLASAAYAELAALAASRSSRRARARRGRPGGAGAASGARLDGAGRPRSRRVLDEAAARAHARGAPETAAELAQEAAPADAAGRRLGRGRSRVLGCGVPRRRRPVSRCRPVARPPARNRAARPAAGTRVAAPGPARARRRGGARHARRGARRTSATSAALRASVLLQLSSGERFRGDLAASEEAALQALAAAERSRRSGAPRVGCSSWRSPIAPSGAAPAARPPGPRARARSAVHGTPVAVPDGARTLLGGQLLRRRRPERRARRARARAARRRRAPESSRPAPEC